MAKNCRRGQGPPWAVVPKKKMERTGMLLHHSQAEKGGVKRTWKQQLSGAGCTEQWKREGMAETWR
jgi:hypothetical protein